jgi:hypothetical protein
VYYLVSQLLEPYTLLVLASLAVCGTMWRVPKWRERAGLAATLCVALLLLLSTPAARHVALGSLEWWYST